jgi:hypothetical protein
VLVRVYDLFAGGKTDKFDILFSLDDADEQILETHTFGVERACWTRAALTAIAEVMVRREDDIMASGEWQEAAEDILNNAKSAFSKFPWHLPDLVEQAPDLHAEMLERLTGNDFGDSISKRAFAKLCKAVVYGYMK